MNIDRIKKFIICIFDQFRANNSHNNNNNSGESNMSEAHKNFSDTNDIQGAIDSLKTDYKISSHFLLCSTHRQVPAVLNLSLKRAYREVGLSDKNNELTEFGSAVFKHIDDEYAKTGKLKPLDLPQVASFSAWD